MVRFIGRKGSRTVLLGGLPAIALLAGIATAAACVVIVINVDCPEGSETCSVSVGKPGPNGGAKSPSPASPRAPSPASPRVPSSPTRSLPASPGGVTSSPATPGDRLSADGKDPRVRELVQAVELRRTAAGCPPLEEDTLLRNAAMDHALELSSARGVASHLDKKGATAQDRAIRLGYRGSVIEVVASGTQQVDEVVGAVEGVMTDSDLLNCTYRSSGAAVVDGFWVLVLGHE